MNSPRSNQSPTYKNLKCRPKHSPIELKEKIRKDYKSRLHNNRDLLLNKFRDLRVEINLKNTLSEIYERMFNFSTQDTNADEENKLWQEIKNELVEEELQWFLEEYDKSEMANLDWLLMEQDSSVICPVCQRNNVSLQNNILYCKCCNSYIKTEKCLADIRTDIFNAIDNHNLMCENEAQFTLVQEIDETHVYFLCNSCEEMQLIV